MSYTGYEPAYQSLAKDDVQKFSFDSPNTIAKHQQLSQQNGGLSAPQPPALPSTRPTFEQKVKISLKTRNWGDQPWGASQRGSYAPPAQWLNNSRSGVSSYPSPGTSYSSGFPTSNYIPSSTIPMHSNYHLPSSQLARSSTPDSIKQQYSDDQTNDDDAYSGFQPTNIPNAPALPTWNNKRSIRSRPVRPLRTRNWGNRTEEGWSHFNRGIYAHESALPFNFNKNRSLASGIQNTIPQQQSFVPQQSYTAPQQSFAPQQSYAPVSRTISFVAPMAAATPVAAQAPLTGRKARKAERKQLKQAAIQHKLVNHLNAPIGNPEVNHYRRGAKAVVPVAPIAGINTGVAPVASGSVKPRRQGRSRRGRSRTATAVLAPVAAASVFTAPQPTFTQPMMQSGAYPSSYTIVQPQSGFSSVSSGIPFTSTIGVSSIPQHPALYSSAAQQIKPLSSTMLNSQGMPISNAPLYSAHEPVAAHILQKQAQAPVAFVRPTGSATF